MITHSYLFPLSQVGLAPYIFVVGLEFHLDIVGRRLVSSVAGMAAPFTLGAALTAPPGRAHRAVASRSLNAGCPTEHAPGPLAG